ncbi:ABC transporter ATP-binding protein [Dehalococcoidia bacterium]|nr:ABC transporter ATP-binding protein [Dehalococcoidia bacterium]
MKPIITLENLSVVYNLGKTNEFWALRDISLDIYPQEHIIFFGPSGCGKSTLLYIIAGLEKPSSGKILVQERDLSLLSEKELIDYYQSSVGIVFQAYYLIPNLNARDNILLPQIFTKESSSQRTKRVQALMTKFGILDFQKRKPSMLSGGQQQRVAIARALINNPSIILADEPVGNLDSKNAEIVLSLIRDLNQKDKKTVIHVTHDPTHLHCANRVFYLKDGKIIREVRNSERATPAALPERKISELERLAQAYPYLSESRLRAKLILNHLLLPYGVETQQKIEQTIDQYLLGKIDEKAILKILDSPPIDLYRQTAQDLTKKIITLTKEIQEIEKIEEEEKEYPATTSLTDEKAMVLRRHLLDDYSGQLSMEQIKRLDGFLAQRIIGKMDKKELEKMFDLPLKKGGIGLNRRTAKRFIREIEIILMKK